MAAGTYTLLANGGTKTYGTSNGFPGTIGSGFVVGQTCVLKSVITRFSAAGTWTGAVRIYTYSAGTLVYSSGSPSTATVNGSGVDTEIVLQNPPTLSPGTTYLLCFYTSAGGSLPGLLTPATTSSFSSTPSGMSASQSSPYWWYSTASDAYPGGSANGSTYWAFQGISTDWPAPTVSALSPSTTFNNAVPATFSWTYTNNGGGAQTEYEIGYRKRAKEVTWVRTTVTSSTSSHTFPKDTFESGVEYEWFVRAKDSNTYSAAVRSSATPVSWTTETEVSSASTTGTVNAGSFTVDNYSFQVRVADNSGLFGPWSAKQTFALGPPSNIYIRIGGTWKQSVNSVKVGGAWKQVPPTDVKSGGSF